MSIERDGGAEVRGNVASDLPTMRSVAELFMRAGLCVSMGEFRRHLDAGAITIAVGTKKKVMLSADDFSGAQLNEPQYRGSVWTE